MPQAAGLARRPPVRMMPSPLQSTATHLACGRPSLCMPTLPCSPLRPSRWRPRLRERRFPHSILVFCGDSRTGRNNAPDCPAPSLQYPTCNALSSSRKPESATSSTRLVAAEQCQTRRYLRLHPRIPHPGAPQLILPPRCDCTRDLSATYSQSTPLKSS